MAGTGKTRERNVQTPGWMRRPTVSPSAGTTGDTAADTATQDTATQDTAAQDTATQDTATQDTATQDGHGQGGSPGAGDPAAPGSRRTRILLLASGGVGVLVVAGVTIGMLGASGSAGHATTVSDHHARAAPAAAGGVRDPGRRGDPHQRC